MTKYVIQKNMELYELCDKIMLQQELTQKVLEFSNDFDFSEIDILLDDYQDISKISDTTSSIQHILGTDEGNVKFLACALRGACKIYSKYKEYGISDDIFVATMKSMTRFCGECMKKTGTLGFDRETWIGRQIGFHLFRIGELEYEIKYGDTPYISIHIPSDADMTFENLKKSFDDSFDFFNKHIPQFSGLEYRCSTWLFSPEIRENLSEISKIRIFCDFFDLVVTDEKSTSFVVWLFQTNEKENFADLKENTSLQRKMKKHLLNGGSISITKGTLKKDFYKDR